jgi:hypothetical protein
MKKKLNTVVVDYIVYEYTLLELKARYYEFMMDYTKDIIEDAISDIDEFDFKSGLNILKSLRLYDFKTIMKKDWLKDCFFFPVLFSEVTLEHCKMFKGEGIQTDEEKRWLKNTCIRVVNNVGKTITQFPVVEADW